MSRVEQAKSAGMLSDFKLNVCGWFQYTGGFSLIGAVFFCWNGLSHRQICLGVYFLSSRWCGRFLKSQGFCHSSWWRCPSLLQFWTLFENPWPAWPVIYVITHPWMPWKCMGENIDCIHWNAAAAVDHSRAHLGNFRVPLTSAPIDLWLYRIRSSLICNSGPGG